MKRIVAFTLLAALLLCGCGAKQEYYVETTTPVQTVAAATTEAITEPTTEPTTEPEPVYYNPLNGQIIDEPFTGRIFASTVANAVDEIPHVGVNQADILMEMFVNHSKVRCLALFTDIESVEAIGSTRSTRLMFNDIAQHYSAILSHAGSRSFIIRNANERGLNHYNVDSLYRQGDPLMQATAYREEKRAAPNNLYVSGAGIKAFVEAQEDVPMTLERDYGLVFTENGTPADGEDAENIVINLNYGKSWKETTMVYDQAAHKYTFWQYGQEMKDYYTEEPEQFDNVVVMFADITVDDQEHAYHVADFVAGGTGYFACGGKIIPMNWTCADEDSAFQFWTEDGEPLPFNQGHTYIAICATTSTVIYGPAEAAE